MVELVIPYVTERQHCDIIHDFTRCYLALHRLDFNVAPFSAPKIRHVKGRDTHKLSLDTCSLDVFMLPPSDGSRLEAVICLRRERASPVANSLVKQCQCNTDKETMDEAPMRLSLKGKRLAVMSLSRLMARQKLSGGAFGRTFVVGIEAGTLYGKTTGPISLIHFHSCSQFSSFFLR